MTIPARYSGVCPECGELQWPTITRHYTYVAPNRVRSTNPGACFLFAGWRRCGVTKGGHGRDQLVILERTRP